MDVEVEVGGEASAGLAQTVGVHRIHHCPRRTHVFLNPTVDERKGLRIERSAQNVRAHVGHQGHIALGHLGVLGAKNGVVGGDVEVGVARVHVTHRGDVVVRRVLGRRHHVDPTCVLGFFDGLGRPRAGVGIRRLSALREEIHRSRQKAQARTTLEVEHLKPVRQAEQFLGQCTALFHGGHKGLAPVGHFNERQAVVVPRANSFGSFLEDFRGQDAGTCRVVVDGGHGSI